MARYVLLDDDPRMGLEAGDELECSPYPLDPTSKLIVKYRVHDGFDPECTLYRHQVGGVMANGEVEAIGCDEDDFLPETRFWQIKRDGWTRVAEGRWARQEAAR